MILAQICLEKKFKIQLGRGTLERYRSETAVFYVEKNFTLPHYLLSQSGLAQY